MIERGWCASVSSFGKEGPDAAPGWARPFVAEDLSGWPYPYIRWRRELRWGTVPRVGTETARHTSSGVRMVESIYSRKKASPTPTNRPPAAATNRLRGTWGDEGSVGISARSLICRFETGTSFDTVVSFKRLSMLSCRTLLVST